MTLYLTDLEAIQSDLDSNYDRGDMYRRVYEATGSAAAVVEGNVSTFSGLLGGTAFLANYYLAEKAEYGGASYSYSMATSDGANDIFKMSQSVADGFISTVINNFNSDEGGNVGIGDGITAAQNTWDNQEPVVSSDPDAYTLNLLNENLGTQFPGMFLNALNSGGTALVSTGDFTTFLAGLGWSADGNQAALAGIAGSILFGKSVSDFTDRSGFTVHEGVDNGDTTFLGMQNYVTQTDSTTEGSKVTMIDSSQLSITSTAWKGLVGVALEFFVTGAVVSGGALGASAALYAELSGSGLNWDAYRAWSLMSDFRAQLLPGSSMQYDFTQYAEANGTTAAQKDFWGYTEQLLGDPLGIVRNAVLNFGMTITGGSDQHYLDGGSGNCTFYAGNCGVTIHSGWGNDTTYGGTGDDIIYPDLGSDAISGGGGFDTVTYSNLDQGITVDVTSDGTTVAKGLLSAEGVDALVGIADIVGTSNDDTFTIYAPTGIVIDGGGGANTADYSGDTAGVTVTRSGSTLAVSDGAGHVDLLTGIDTIITTHTGSSTDIFTLGAATGLIIEGDSGDVVNYSDATLDQATGEIFSADDSAHDTLSGFSSGNIHGITGYRPNFATNETLASGYSRYDYSAATAGGTFTIAESNSVSSTGSDLWNSYYTVTETQSLSVTVGGHTQSGDVREVSISAYGLHNALNDAEGGVGETYIGTNHGDTVTIDGNAENHVTAVTFVTGTGNDDITIDPDSTWNSGTNIIYNGGDKDIHNAAGLSELFLGGSVTSGDVTVGSYSGGTLVLDVTGATAGTITLEHYSSDTQIFTVDGLLNPTLPATTDGYGSGYGITPIYDNSGNVISLRLDPGVTQSYVPSDIGTEVMNPFVLIGFSTYSDGTSQHTAIYYASYVQGIQFASGISPGDVWFSASTNGGNASLEVHAGSTEFTIPYFESGRTIDGYGLYASDVHSLIQGADSGTLTADGGYDYEGAYLGGALGSFSLGSSMSITEYLQFMSFANGAMIDLAGNLTFNAPSDGASIYGLESRTNEFVGHGGADYFYGGPNNDTFLAGSGVESMYGGVGNNTFTFSSGFNSDNIQATASAGTNTIHLTGIDPADVRLWTDSYGYLHVEDTTNPSDNISVLATVTGDNNAESTIGTYINSITFDSSYATTWDLTAGLHITGDNSGDTLYGTAYDDVITGGTGVDNIYGNAGNDTIIGGTGADGLYGGPGDDTYVFSSGFGSATVHESLSEGSDTIHLTGINPADVRLWTDAYGYLHIEDTTNPSDNISVVATVTGDNNAESTIGSYVEQITFDSSYSTTWDLTGGLHITGDNSGDTLYGTAYDDVITGGTGVDNIYGNAGNDTIIGGTGADGLYGGPGDDTYVFSSGFGSATVHESLSEGSDTIHLTGINPADVHLWTDAYGYLHIEDTTNPSDNISVVAAVTGDNNAESTIGSYVEQITFDSSYSTTWDLTGGLHITGDNSGDTLYGTAYDDVITGGTGVDNIYGNAGNDTIIGGTGADGLYGGPGDDTYVFSSGFGSATVHESLSEGSDTIHLTGIDPANVHLWTDGYGYLHIEDTTNPSDNISVVAAVTGDNNAESTVGSYVEQITFDSSYSTTWDLTGGLHITGDNSGDYLYGTAYGDTITGGTGVDVLYGNAGNDVLYGAGGNDQLTGGPGADTFLFKAASAETGVATIEDFNTSDGDKIDLADVISTYDPATMAIANFVQLATSGSDTQVKVDTDGSGTSYTQIATIQGVTGLTLADLITDGNLIVHHT